jgi:hypothetical protein
MLIMSDVLYLSSRELADIARTIINPDMDDIYQKIVDFIDNLDPNVEVTKLGSFPPLAENPETPAAESVVTSLERVWGLDVVEIPMLPGSILAGYFKHVTDVPVLVVPYANPDQNNHGRMNISIRSVLKMALRPQRDSSHSSIAETRCWKPILDS